MLMHASKVEQRVGVSFAKVTKNWVSVGSAGSRYGIGPTHTMMLAK